MAVKLRDFCVYFGTPNHGSGVEIERCDQPVLQVTRPFHEFPFFGLSEAATFWHRFGRAIRKVQSHPWFFLVSCAYDCGEENEVVPNDG